MQWRWMRMFLYTVSYFGIWLKKRIQYDHHKILVLSDVNLPFHLLTQVSTLGISCLNLDHHLANYMQKCSLARGHFYFNLFSIIWYQKFLQTDSHKFWIQLYTSRYFYSNENSTALGFQFLYLYGGSFFFVTCILQNDWHGLACCLELIISNSVLEPNGSSSQSLSQCT